MTFDVEITRFRPEPATERLTAVDASVAEVAVAGVGGATCVVLATHVGARGAGDDFHAWLAGERALLRRDAHREWHALDPAWAAAAAGDLWFTDSDGSAFPAQNGETVSRPQAFDALSLWLRTGELLPSLDWR